jgi:hypothetical protein
MQRFSMDLLSANHCHCESLCFVLQSRHMQTNRGISSAYYSRKPIAHAPEICTKRSAHVGSENVCELMNALQKMSSLPTKVITPEN